MVWWERGVVTSCVAGRQWERGHPAASAASRTVLSLLSSGPPLACHKHTMTKLKTGYGTACISII